MLIETVQDENWKDVKALLMDALAVDPPQRHQYVQKQPVTREIKAEVESLLAFEDDAKDILQTSAFELSKDFFDDGPETPCTAAGQEIGAYRIVSELGVGGMGAVYLAERSDGKFDQRVAIKLLRREFNAGKLRESFRREIEIQSRLVHPNVATMLDTGRTDDGIPYIVMEYVEGLSIDEYCRENNLGLIERLKIFNRSCDAVAFAHQNLIVHRDLKPSNIIVTPNGDPKLLDFGISKLLGVVDDGEGMTVLGAMTPEYASPEQIQGRQVTTTTDIYSLGVLLFKLLTDTFPYDIKSNVNGDLLREITDSEPMLPSEAALLITQGKKEQKAKEIGNFAVSGSRRVPILPSRLVGDLDNIILKALKKEPEHRYRTVEQFTEDIWRYIDGVPVLARPATFAYRFKKFYARNRVTVIAGALIVATMFAGIGVSMWQASVARAQTVIAEDARNAAVAEAEHAKTEQAKSEKISKFMAKVFSYANPAWFAEGARYNGDAKVIQVMDDLGGKIDAEFATDPDIAAELHHKFAEVYNIVRQREDDAERAGQFRQTQRFHALRALELRRQFYGDRHELIAKDMMFASAFVGDDSEQAAMLAQAIQMMRETNPRNLNLPYMLEGYANRLSNTGPVDLSYIYLRNALPPATAGKDELAEKYYLEMLELFQWHYAKDEYPIYFGNCYVAWIKAKLRKPEEGRPYYQYCKDGENKFQNKDQLRGIRSLLDKIAKASVDEGGQVE